MANILMLWDEIENQMFLETIFKVVGYQFVGLNSLDQAFILMHEGTIDFLIMYFEFIEGKHWTEVYDLMKNESRLANIGVIILSHPYYFHKGADVHAYGDEIITSPITVRSIPESISKVAKNYGKTFSLEALQIQFEKNREELKGMKCSDEELDGKHQRLLQYAGF